MKNFKEGDLVWVNEKSDYEQGAGYLWWGRILTIHEVWAKVIDLSDSMFQGEIFMRHFSTLELKCET